MNQPCTSPTVFGQQCSEKFVTLLGNRPLGGQLQLSTPTQSPENPYVASTPAMEIVVHAPSSTPRVSSASKYTPVNLERDKTKLTTYHSSDAPKILGECNRQLFTVKQGIGGLVAISSPASSSCRHSTAASMQSTPIHPSSMSSPSYSFPVVSPFASYTTPVTTNIFDDSLLKESPDLEMLSEVALQTSPSASHRNFLRHHQRATITISPDEEDETDTSQSYLSNVQRNHVPCILRKRKSSEYDVGTSPPFSTEERTAFDEHFAYQQNFSPSMLLNAPLLHHQKGDYHKTKKKHKSLDKGGRSFISSTPIRDGKMTIFSPLTKSHDVAYDSYRDSGYLTRMESTSGIYSSPIAYYDQQQSSNNNIKGSMPLHDSNLRNQDWESYDENLIPARKSKLSPTGSALKPVRPSEVFRDCRELSSEEFLHRYVLVQAIEKAKSGHYVKKSRFAPDWARFVYGLTDEQLEVTASAKQFLLKTQDRFL